MCAEARRLPHQAQRGLTFVELIFFIVIVSAGLAGILTVLNVSTSRSADPMVRKQMLVIAEGVMEEVRLQSFGWCDPDDANATTATTAGGCAGGTPAETMMMKKISSTKVRPRWAWRGRRRASAHMAGLRHHVDIGLARHGVGGRDAGPA